jgi:hypothetical protein
MIYENILQTIGKNLSENKKDRIALTILTLLIVVPLSGQSYTRLSNPSYSLVSSPGFVNITGIESAIGLRDSSATNSKYYFSLINVFGYQADRNFFAGIGAGFYYCENNFLIPLYLENKYSLYLKGFTPYFYADGGLLLSIKEVIDESKIFVNPGFGISRYFSPKIEGSLSVGYMLQARTTLNRVSFLNFKLSIIYRAKPYRLFKKPEPDF